MKRFLLRIWRVLPPWMERLASVIIRPRYHVPAGAIVFNKQGQILLCRHTSRRLYPWGLPGGDIKYGDDPAEAVRRELWEETGLIVENVRLLLVESSKEFHKVSLTYLCTGISGTFIPNEEVSMIQYFDTGALPDLSKEQLTTIVKAIRILRKSDRLDRSDGVEEEMEKGVEFIHERREGTNELA
jgi:8-oxo-dGTP diphosphatase